MQVLDCTITRVPPCSASAGKSSTAYSLCIQVEGLAPSFEMQMTIPL
jgi:hypothetical protein